MKVYIGPYSSRISPWTIAEKIFFWKDKYKNEENDEFIYNVGEWLATKKNGEDTWLFKICERINSKFKRKIKVKIHKYDTWSADTTLAYIIHPVLKLVRDSKQGAPSVDDEDVPEELKSTSAPPLTEEEKSVGSTDANWFKRWDYILDEMIWAFEQHLTEWDYEIYYKDGQWDHEGRDKHQARIDNGLRLFGKYYNGLWT